MSLEKSSIQWSAKQIKSMVLNGKINFDHIVQRSYVWEKSRKTGLIESMILGYPVPVIYAKRIVDDKNKNYYILDGKQRLSTIAQYLNDEFELTEIPEVVYFDEESNCECQTDITGLKFSELPDAIKDNLNTITFTITYFDNLDKEEERQLFKRLNAGKPLSAKSRLLASCKDIEGMLDIGSHDLFKQMLSEKSFANKNQVTLVIKAWCMLNKDMNELCFDGKAFNPLVENTVINDGEKLELNEVFNLIVDVHDIILDKKNKKVAKKLYTETHMISLVPFFKRAIEEGLDKDLIADWVINFYDSKVGASNNEVYNRYCGGGTGKNTSIFTRNTVLEESYNDFFKSEEIEDELLDDSEDEDVEESLEIEDNSFEESNIIETETEIETEDEDIQTLIDNGIYSEFEVNQLVNKDTEEKSYMERILDDDTDDDDISSIVDSILNDMDDEE